MKIFIAAGGNARDKKTWSGTPSTMIKLLEERNISVTDYNLFNCLGIGFKILYKLFNKFVYIQKSTRYPILYGITKKPFDKALKKADINNILFISENHYVDDSSKKVFLYFDAAPFPLLTEAVRRKIGFKYLFKQFEKNDRKIALRADYIFTQNDWSRLSLIERYGIAENKIENIGFGINLKPYLGEKSYDNNLLLIVLRKGNEKIKGLFLLRDAFRILRKEMPEVNLAVVGTELEPEEGITYYYNKPRSLTEELFVKSTLYVMPALAESNGITYLEALANKTPIVGLNRFAFPEFSGNGQYGFICNNDDPEELANVIKNALKNKRRLATMGVNGQKFIKRYTWNNVIDKILNRINEYE